MTKEEMIKRVCETHESMSGYNYNPDVVKEIIETGVVSIPNGFLIEKFDKKTAVWKDGKIIISENGEVLTELDDEKSIENALIKYAYVKSNIGVSMGSV